jgi:8-oxo-dGTP diphosphatase
MQQSVQDPGRFLAGIAGLIRNGAGEYLLLKRNAERDFGAEIWECVTGRVNQGEGFEAALHREVMEETGLRVQIDTIVGLSHFYRGDAVTENELQGVAFGCSILGDAIVAQTPEHAEHRWMSGQDALAFLTATDPGTVWFRTTIQRAEDLYAIMPPDWPGIHATGITLD